MDWKKKSCLRQWTLNKRVFFLIFTQRVFKTVKGGGQEVEKNGTPVAGEMVSVPGQGRSSAGKHWGTLGQNRL